MLLQLCDFVFSPEIIGLLYGGKMSSTAQLIAANYAFKELVVEPGSHSDY